MMLADIHAFPHTGTTYKAKGKDYQRTRGMGKHAKSKESDILQCHHQIPQEIARGHALNHPRRTSITPNPLQGIHILALLIGVHDP